MLQSLQKTIKNKIQLEGIGFIKASEDPHTEAIEEEELDSVISDTKRIV